MLLLRAFLLFHLCSSVASWLETKIRLECPNVNVSRRVEGFVAHSCTPGPLPGSCLVFLLPSTFQEAVHRCFLNYGGRLATIADKRHKWGIRYEEWKASHTGLVEIQKWRSAMFWHPTLNVEEGNKTFWIGMGKETFEFTIVNNEAVRHLRVEDLWQMLLSDDYLRSSFLTHEQGIQLPDGSELCPAKRAIFNPLIDPGIQGTANMTNYFFHSNKHLSSYDKPFSVVSTSEKHYAICEVPKWVLLQCPEGWDLMAFARMCIKIFPEKLTFSEALRSCNAQNAGLAVPSTYHEQVFYTRHMNEIFKHDPPREVPMWIGFKVENGNFYALDDSKVYQNRRNPKVPNQGRYCAVMRNEIFMPMGQFLPSWKDCGDTYPYMCSMFADQSMASNPSKAQDGEKWHI